MSKEAEITGEKKYYLGCCSLAILGIKGLTLISLVNGQQLSALFTSHSAVRGRPEASTRIALCFPLRHAGDMAATKQAHR